MMRRFLFALALLYPLAAHAQALPCAAYPNTLTNGTLADANQVMANFNTIRNCVNGLAPIGVPTVGATSNVKGSVASASASVTITADSVTVGTALNGTSYTLTSYSQLFNGATTGAGGMDTGTLPSSTFVALYAIYNPTSSTTSILGTTCATSCPTIYAGGNMPAGYTASALLTTVPTNATPQIPGGTYVRGKTVWYSGTTVLSTSTAHGSVTTLGISAAVPPNAVTIYGYVQSNCGTTPGASQVSVSLYVDTNGSSQTSGAANCASVAGAFFQMPYSIGIPTAQTLYYENVVAGTSPTSIIVVSAYIIP